MKALILNSGTGSRMGELAADMPKCLTNLITGETILRRQLHQIAEAGLKEVVITTGAFDKTIRDYCNSLNLALDCKFVKNEVYNKTNYIYSMYLASDLLDGDVVLLHGDLVFHAEVLQRLLSFEKSGMIVSDDVILSQKDFKAAIFDGKIVEIGTELFADAVMAGATATVGATATAVMAQPLYKLRLSDWLTWKTSIAEFCEAGRINCYAEDAFNAKPFPLFPLDVGRLLCAEIDNPADLQYVNKRLAEA